jgi:hypothetical protein
MINPKESRLFEFWHLVMLVCYLLELVLIPYVIFVGGQEFLEDDEHKRWIYSIVFDALHVLNIFVILCTQI